MSKKQVMKEIFEEKINKNRIYQNVLLKIEDECKTNNGKNNKFLQENVFNILNKFMMKQRIAIGIALSIFIVSGVVLASNVDNIKKYFRGLGIGIDSAIEHGYIETTDMNYINDNVSVSKEPHTIIDNINLEAKIEDFLMDDHKKTFDEYCNNHNLDYTFCEFNENYLNNGLECFSYYDKEDKVVKLVYNMYTDKYPNSKKLNFSFNKLILTEENNENKIELKGEWEINLDVPEKMYNRQSSSYKVINCENPNFQVTKAILTDTGFEFGLIISNIEKPKAPQVLKELFEKLEDGEIEDEEYNKLVEDDEAIKKASEQYWYQMAPIQLAETETGRDITYVENERGEIFVQAGSQQEYKFIDGDKFIFYQIFGMSKYDSTDKIKVIVTQVSK